MTLLDILTCSLLTLSVWGVNRILLGAHEVIPGVNEPPQNGYHPEYPESRESPTPLDGAAYTGGALRGLISVFLLSLGFWCLIYLGLRVML